MSDFDYDLFVIGGGSGGVRAARVASAQGARVALAEESRMGGTCVIRGCVPKKLMVFASGYREGFSEARAYGWDVQDGEFHWPVFRAHLHAELTRLERAYRKMLEVSGVEIFDARAIVSDAHSVSVDGIEKTAKHILVATGGRPTRPEMANAQLGIVSDDIFDLDTLPKRLLIIGGGYIACEFASIMTGLGVQVTQFYRGAQILRGFDEEARGLIAEMMREQGIDLHLGTNIVEMAPENADHSPSPVESKLGAALQAPAGVVSSGDTGGPLWVKSTNGHEGVFDQVLFATGRTPNTDGMGLAEVGVTVGRRGKVVVDEYSQTSVPSIYAIGDVTNRVNLTPVAIREGMAFVETVFKGNPTPVDHDLIPSAVFTTPEYGSIGLTEETAREQEPIEVYCTSFRPMQTAFAGKPWRVLMKLIVSVETRKVLGCHIVAPTAGEMIQLAGIAVRMGATKEDFDRTVAVHPTMSEEIVTMREPIRTS